VDKEYLFSCRLLGLNEHFTLEELKNAYRQCVAKYHPDHYANAPAYEKQHLEDILKQINDAYMYLKSTAENTQLKTNNSNLPKGRVPDENWREIMLNSFKLIGFKLMLNSFNTMVERWSVLNNTFDKALKSHIKNKCVDYTYIYIMGIKLLVIETLRMFLEMSINTLPESVKLYPCLSSRNFEYFDDLHQSNLNWVSDLNDKNWEIYSIGYNEAISIFSDIKWQSITPFRDYVTHFIGRDWE
jgi:hypothetical protein